MVTRAEGQASHAEGSYGTALGSYSHVEGFGSHQVPDTYTSSTTNDTILTSWGTNRFSLAKGDASHVEGRNSLALGDYSHTEGYQTIASGVASHSSGCNTTASGNYSYTAGYNTTASGECSHAEGGDSVAKGTKSHAEGVKTTALGANSHAEGSSSSLASSSYTTSTSNDTIIADHANSTKTDFSLAKGDSSHVEGMNCLALGNYSHAEGDRARAKGVSAHAEGGATYANGNYSHAEGWNTFANGANSHAEGQHSDATGKNSHAEGLSSYADSECQHVQGKYNVRDYNNKYAHIVGNGSSSAHSNAHTLDWDGNAWFKGDVYIGGTSQDNTNAKKLQTAITGAATTVVNDNLSTSKVLVSDSSGKIAASSSITTTELGYLDGVSSNVQTQLNNKLSTVDPTGTGELSLNRKSDTVIGLYSVAIGYNTTASDGYTMATGYSTTASKSYSHAEGYETTASGEDSHAEGYKTTASGNHSHAEGWTTTASGESSHAEGEKTAATGYSAHAEGYYATASGNESHAEGYYTTALGKYSHAEGRSDSNVSSKYTSSTSNDTIIADWNTAQFSLAKGEASHVEGFNNLALGNYSHAEGFRTIALGAESHAEGYQTVALLYQHALGYCNNTNTATEPGGMGINSGTAFVIGNGSPSKGCSNAFRVNYNGTVYAQSSTLNTGADYAEYFEWQDSNPDAEDRRGYFVTLDGDKIRIAKSDDYILGIVSGQPAIIGNGDEDWRGRYILDEFGAFITEEFEYDEEIPETVVDEETGETRTEIKTVTKTGMRYKQNPDYDPSLPYVQRADRPEWDAVGMMGVLSVRDDGTCQVNGYCKVAEGGIATASDSGYRVMKRINDHIVQVVFR